MILIQTFLLLSIAGLFLFGLVDMAFSVLMRLPQRLEAERESEGTALDAYLEDPLTFFVPSRILRGTMLVIVGVLGAQLVDPGFVGGVTLFSSLFAVSYGLGVVFPAIIVRRSPEQILNLLLPVFTIAANLISPLTALVLGWLGPVERPGQERINGPSEAVAPADTPSGEPQESDQAQETRLLRSVVEFGDTLVGEVMTPRPDIVAIPSDATINDLRLLIQGQKYSRLPVYTENLDNIVGLVVVKDLIQVPEPVAGSRKVTEIMRPAAFVPESKHVGELLRELQQKRQQLAIVVDEYGGTAGLVTVEDVLEELVGEIRDEYDSEAEPVVRESDDVFVFSAKVAIEEMVDRLGVSIDEEGFETVGGYVLARVGRVPAVGEHFESDGLEVEVLEAERRRVHKVRVRRVGSE